MTVIANDGLRAHILMAAMNIDRYIPESAAMYSTVPTDMCYLPSIGTPSLQHTMYRAYYILLKCECGGETAGEHVEGT